MSKKQEPTEERIRAAIEARIDRLLALEELSWELQSFAEDLWGPVPEAWSDGVAELAAALSRGEPLAGGETGGASWEAGRSQILAGLRPDERWLIGLSNHLWDHAFDGGRATIRRAAIESFLTATMTYIREHPEVPRPDHQAVDEASVAKRGH
jgi:predicted NACHT family NTPase